uniref:RING-type E3 ubiquitin transferase n=1 Tax=Solanum chacoense TaxID=4108 RepID=A0A0V0IM09_SOLCH
MVVAIYTLCSHFVWLALSAHCIEAVAEGPYIGLIGDPPCPECGGPYLINVTWAEDYPRIDKLGGLVGALVAFFVSVIFILVLYKHTRTMGRDTRVIRDDRQLEMREVISETPPQTLLVEGQQDGPPHPQSLPMERPFVVRHPEASILVNTFLARRISREECANMCEICQLDYDEGQLVRVLPSCGHFYHHICILNWMTFGALNCPHCRAVI